MGAPQYTDDEAQEILRRALEHEDAGGVGIAHQDLLEAAREVGIAPETVERAAVEMRLERAAEDAVEARRRRKRSRWFRGLLTYLIVNAFLFALDTLMTGGTWFYWPLLVWGLFVALGGLRALLPPTEEARARDVEKEARRIRKRQKAEVERRRREQARSQRKKAESHFEESVERGVGLLLSAIAGRLDHAGRVMTPPARADGEFGRYVDQKRGRQDRAETSPAPNVPPVRVGEPAEQEEEPVYTDRERSPKEKGR